MRPRMTCSCRSAARSASGGAAPAVVARMPAAGGRALGGGGRSPSPEPSRALREIKVNKDTMSVRLGIRFVRDDDGFGPRVFW